MHVPDAGVPNCWTTGAGPELDEELEEGELLVNPPPASDHVAIVVIGVAARSLDNLEKIVAFTVPASKEIDPAVIKDAVNPVPVRAVDPPPVRSIQPEEVRLPLTGLTVMPHGPLPPTPGPEVFITMMSVGARTPGRPNDEVALQFAATTTSIVYVAACAGAAASTRAPTERAPAATSESARRRNMSHS